MVEISGRAPSRRPVTAATATTLVMLVPVLVMKALLPSITHSAAAVPPSLSLGSSRAVVRIAPTASDPPPGSVSPNAPSVSPEHRRGSQRRFCFGRGGPYAQGRAYDLLVQAEAGSCAITGSPGRPAKPGIPVADIGAGMYALSSVLAALFVRERTGQGTAISVGLFDSVAEWMGYALNLARYAGVDLEPNGVSSPAVAPYGAYPAADGQTLVLGTTNDREWRRLALDVLHRPDLAGDPRYAGNRDRVARRADLDAAIGAWAAGRPLAECRKAAEAAGLGHARLNRPTEVLSHPQLAERGRWQEIGSPVGPVLGLLPPPESADWDWRLDPIPALGEHTGPVLRELGYDAGDLEAMRARGVIREVPAAEEGS
jgi:crotonobetainyl-CoA:carnitine CoA-transferase CaiB-like acyl-CoA transferase